MAIDFRSCLNALSDVIINRPPPLRKIGFTAQMKESFAVLLRG
jgi:hypothetical protein